MVGEMTTKTQRCRFAMTGFLCRVTMCLCVSVVVFFSAVCRAEVLDRMMAVVEGHIVTLSDLRQERQIRSQLGEKTVDDDTVLTKQLVDSYLVERQIGDYPNIDVTEAEVDAVLRDSTAPTTLASETLRDAVRRRIRVQKFFDIKFRQLIRPTDDEIRKYYDDVFVPRAKEQKLQSIPPITDPQMVTAIRENVVQEKMDHELDVWLEAIRRRSSVEVFH
jgi:hypothetical protein